MVWRPGGRETRKRYATLPTETMAESARQLVEIRLGRITPEEVYAAVWGGGTRGAEAPPTLAEFARTWVEQRRTVGEVQPDTITDQHRILIRHVLPWLGQTPVDAVTRDTVQGWVAWLVTQPARRGGKLDADTVRHAHAVLHSLLGAAVPRWLPANPAARIPGQRKGTGLPKATPHEPVFLTAVEIDLILANCSPAIRDLVLVAVLTGLRRGELLALRVEDVTVAGPRKVVRVRQALKRDGSFGPPKSRRSRRDVPISGTVAEALAPHLEGRAGHLPVFVSPRGHRWHPENLSRRHWARAVAAARRCPEHPPPQPEKPLRGPRRKLRPDEVSTCDCPGRLHRVPRFHDLRHTHASLCIEAGWRETRVSRRLGHETISTTVDLYGHLWDGEADDRLDAVERLLLLRQDEAA